MSAAVLSTRSPTSWVRHGHYDRSPPSARLLYNLLAAPQSTMNDANTANGSPQAQQQTTGQRAEDHGLAGVELPEPDTHAPAP